MATRHEIPTHLAVEDRLLAGLTMPQLLVLLVGGCAGYVAWQGAGFLPATARLTLAGWDAPYLGWVRPTDVRTDRFGATVSPR